MTIDEALDRVADIIANMHNDYVDYLTCGGKADAEKEADIHALDDVHQALAWYRNQDLIRREDVKKIKPCEYCKEFNGYESPCIRFNDCKIKALAKAINIIPKVEYTGIPIIDKCPKVGL